MQNRPAPLTLRDAFKTDTTDQDKTLSPEETVRRFRNRLQAIDLDLLKETVRIDNGRLDIPVFFSQCGVDAQAVIGTRKQMGKGATPDQAEASAVMELAERFSFFSFRNDPDHFRRATYPQVQADALPYSLIHRSVEDDAETAAKSRAVFDTVPLHWTRGYNLTRQHPVLVPFDWFFALNEFNGPSAGNCLEEAILQGLCEVVERHVSATVSRDRLPVPQIRPESARHPTVVELIGKFSRAGVLLHLSDFTLDIGIPTVAVLAHDPATFPESSELVWTAGTAPDPEKALGRALTETAQLGGDFNTGGGYVASGLPKLNHPDEAAFLTRQSPRINLADLPDLSSPNIKIEIDRCIAALARQDLEVIVVDITHPLLGIPACYIIIPGARFRERAVGASVGMISAKLLSEGLPPRRALAALKAVDAALPGQYYVQFYLGTAQLAAGEPDAAISHLEAALTLGPADEDVPSIYSYLGVALKDLGHYRRALAVLEKGLQLDSHRIDIHNLMGFCHFKLGEHEAAIARFESAVRIDPGSALDYANIATNYRELGDRDKAIEYYLTALTIDPSLEIARDNLDKLRKGD
jgi:ribosomal protein S12 methylthiotransferase accessory factor